MLPGLGSVAGVEFSMAGVPLVLFTPSVLLGTGAGAVVVDITVVLCRRPLDPF